MVPSRTISQKISLNIPPRSQSLSIFFRAFRLQLRVLHFDAPHPGILEDIQCLMLRELRIDISVAVSGKAEFDCLGKMNLEVLEFSGQTDVFQFLPSMMTLRELYLPIDKGTFSRTTLNDIATRTPDLKKLVLRFEYGLSLALSAPDKLQGIIKSFREPTRPIFLEAWGLEDIGILNPSHVIPLEYAPLMEGIAEQIPAIHKLYGRSKRILQAGGRVDDGWDGELNWMKNS